MGTSSCICNGLESAVLWEGGPFSGCPLRREGLSLTHSSSSSHTSLYMTALLASFVSWEYTPHPDQPQGLPPTGPLAWIPLSFSVGLPSDLLSHGHAVLPQPSLFSSLSPIMVKAENDTHQTEGWGKHQGAQYLSHLWSVLGTWPGSFVSSYQNLQLSSWCVHYLPFPIEGKPWKAESRSSPSLLLPSWCWTCGRCSANIPRMNWMQVQSEAGRQEGHFWRREDNEQRWGIKWVAQFGWRLSRVVEEAGDGKEGWERAQWGARRWWAPESDLIPAPLQDRPSGW